MYALNQMLIRTKKLIINLSFFKYKIY